MNQTPEERFANRPIVPDGPLRVGILGFGRLAQNYYVPALRRIGREMEISVADPLEGSRAAAARLFGDVQIFSEYEQLLESGAPHALLVSTPPSTHLDIWRAAAAIGVPVFMEKPFLLPHELDQIDETDRAWQDLMIDFNRRFWPTYRALGHRVADGALGGVRRARFVLNVDVRKWSTVSNHRAEPQEGGALYDLGSQVLDLVFVTFHQRPAEILARQSGNGGLEERVEIALDFPDGLVVNCDLAYGRRNRESLTIEGEDAVLRLGDANFLAWVERRASLPGRVSRTILDFAAFGYRGLLRNRSMLRYSVRAALETFFDTLRTPEPFRPGFEDALRVARCARAATDSIARGRPVSLS